jgi:Icc-related predicted phosphoesterase
MRGVRKELYLKILPISDIHGKPQPIAYIKENFDRGDFDAIVASGDLWEGRSPNGKYRWDDLQKAFEVPIVMIQGNHDYFENNIFDQYPNIHLLHNDTIEIDGVKFFGTPYTVNFCDWNYMNDEKSLYDMWDIVVPKNIDVLLSHGPPFGYGDNCNQKVYNNDEHSHLGSKALREIILKKNPKYCIFGHIHSGDRKTVMDNGTICLNVSCLDEAYQFGGFNPYPEVVELELN